MMRAVMSLPYGVSLKRATDMAPSDVPMSVTPSTLAAAGSRLSR